jgi:hypothetical protein
MACACPAIIRAELPLEEFPRDASPIIDRKVDSPTRAETARLRRTDPDLVGTWQLLLPAGFERRITLKPAGENRYRLEPANLNFAGVYESHGDQFVLAEPNDPRLRGFEFKVRSPYLLTLTGQAENTGADYLGAVLFRSNDRVPKGE